MSLSYRGPAGTIEYRWIAYALLRDNVLHHMESRGAALKYPLLHRISEALSGDPLHLDAVGLRAEVTAVHSALLAKPISELAVSGRTRALLSFAAPLPGEAMATELARDCGFTPKSLQSAANLDDAFGYLVRGLLQITEGATAGSQVEVVDL